MTTFLDLVRKATQERKQREYVIKGGKGSGWYGPPKGTHTPRRHGRIHKIGGGLSKEVKGHIAAGIIDVQSHGFKTGNEAAMSINAKGEKIDGTVTGGEDHCDIEKITDGNEFVMVHNHPGNSSFSSSDVAMLFYSNMQHAVVVGHDGTLYRVSRTSQTIKLSGNDQVVVNKVSSVWTQEMLNFMPKFQPRVAKGEIGENEAWKEHSHLTMIKVAERLGLDYERILP